MGRTINDKQVELLIGGLLRIGVIVAASVAAVGGIWFLIVHGAEVPRYAAFRGEPGFLRSIPGVIQGVIQLRSEAVVQLGILLLIAVPLLRVAVSVVAFALERDWLYVVVTVLVLAILVFSLLGGRF